VQSLIIKV